MSKDYVKIETNMMWYNTNDIIYLILYQYLMDFLAKIKLPENAEFHGKPMMSKAEADEIGAVYDIDEDATELSISTNRAMVFVRMPATLEHLIAAYDAAEWDEKSDWWAKASQIVPHMWD